MADGYISQVHLPNDTTYDLKVRSDNIFPIISKTFNCGKYEQDGNDTHFYETIGSIVPDDFNLMWKIRYLISIEVPSDSTYTYTADVEFYGVRNTYTSYKIFNAYYSKYPIYQHMFLEGSSISYPHEFGYRIRSSYGEQVIKTVKIDVLEAINCTVSLFNSPKAYTSAAVTNYTWRGFNATSNGLQETGDANDTALYIYSNGFKGKAGSNKIYYYTLFAKTSNNTYESFVMQNNTTGTTKTKNPHGFVPDGKIYWNSGATTYNEGNFSFSVYEQYHALDYRYSFNITSTTMPDYCETYVKYTYNPDDNLLYLADEWFAVNPSADADNNGNSSFIYQRIGSKYYTGTSNYYQGSLLLDNPYYEYKNNTLQSWHAPTSFITSTYVKKSGDTMTGNLILNAASGNSPSLLFTRDGSLTDWKILVTSGKLSFQSATDGSTWTERAYFKDNSGDFVATSFTGSGASLTSLNASNISSGTLSMDRIAANAIANGKLANSKITIAGNEVSLGGSLAASTLTSSLGLSNAMHFIGIVKSDSSSTPSDGDNETPTIDGLSSYTPAAGDVVIDKDKVHEYVYTSASKWELLGGDSSYKVTQTDVTKPTAVTNKWVSAIGQNANGVIDVSYATLDTSGLIVYYNNHDKNIDTLTAQAFVQTAEKAGGNWTGTKPTDSHNGVALFNFHTHSGNYYTQLALDTNQNRLWLRSANNATTYGAWTKIATIADIQALDVSDISGFGTGKTLATLTETDGKIAATFQDIEITKSQISDFPTEMTPASHTHGNITNDGKVGTTANRALMTGTGGAVSAASTIYMTNTNLGINVTTITSPKLISGASNTQTTLGTMFQVTGGSYFNGTIVIPANRRAIEFRPDHASYASYIYYGTSGNEALNFVNIQSVTSFIFWTGNRIEASDHWYVQSDVENKPARVDNPAIQIKQNSLYINKLLPSGTNASYKLYVNGTTYLGDNVTLANQKYISREGNTVSWNSSNTGAMLRQTSVNNWAPMLAMKSHTGWWNMGHYNHNGYNDHLLFTFLADVDVAGVTNAQNHMDYTVRLIPTIYATNTTNTTDRAFVTSPWANDKAAVGSTKKPVYIDDNGVATEISYTIEKSVPSNAVFTDHYAWGDITNKPTSIALTGAVTASATTLGSGAISIETTVNHGHGDITTDGKLANANRIVWTDANKKLYAGYHYANSTKIAINSSSEPTENLYVSGTIQFNLGTANTSSNNRKFIVLGADSNKMSIAPTGIQVYNSSNAVTTMYLQAYGGNLIIGASSSATATRDMYGVFDFKSSTGFNYSGMGAGSDNVARNIWFSYNGKRGTPVYDDDFKYNPSTNTITIGTGSLSATTYSGNAANVTGTVAIDHGGTGKTSASEAWTALGGGASGKHADSYFVKAVTSTDNAIVRFDGTSGQVQNSKVTIDDSSNIVAGINRILNQTDAPDQGEIPITAFGLKTGYPVYDDPTFKSGSNSVSIYNNSGGGTVVHTRDIYSNFSITSPGTDSNYVIQIKTSGTASPGYGGFVQTITARANAVFVQIFRALVPEGRSLALASNNMGNTYKDQWLTSNAGTGKWEWYARRVICGKEGTMSGGGHVYITGGAAGTTESPVIWYLAACNLYDVTKMQYDGLWARYADRTVQAKISSTKWGIAYYTDTTGTFGSKASANGALYATSANGELSWGTLPIAQGGTGKTTAADAWTALGGGASGKHADSYFVKAVTSTDNAIVRFDGTSGQVQNSNAILDDNGCITLTMTSSDTSVSLLKMQKASTLGWPSTMKLITMVGYNDKEFSFKFSGNCANVDIGYDWLAGHGAGLALRSADFEQGKFILYARATIDGETKGYNLEGTRDGVLTWSNRRVVTATNNTQRGSTTKPVYIDSWGIVNECTDYSNATVAKAGAANLTTTADTLAYYTDNAGAFGNASKIMVYHDADVTVQSATKKRDGLRFYGSTYGNTAADLTSNTAGVIRYEDGGVRLEFSASATGGSDNGALIFTNHDSANTGGGSSFHFVGQNGSNNTGGNLAVTAPDFVARRRMAVGYNFTDTNYALKVNGASYLGGPLKIGAADAAANTGYATANVGSQNYIAFYGVYGDNPGSFNHTYIGESIYGSKTTANEQSELLLFHGNDPGSGSGPDRIRLLAGQIDLCVYTAATSGTWDAIRQTAGTKVANFANGQVTITGNLLPEANNTRNLGSSDVKWANVYATTFTGNLTGNAATATQATLIKPIASTTTASASTWNIPSGCKQVWGERFSDTTLKYTPSGGSETTITDTGDWVIWLQPSANSNAATLNMRIDGTYYGSFNGGLSGNASTATKLKDNASNTTASFWRGDNSWSNTLSGASTNFASAILTVTNTSDTGWIPTGAFIASNMTTTHWAAIEIGKKLEDKNCGHLSFYYAGDKSTNNRFELGFYNVTSILNIRADKRVGVNITAPTHDLTVNGDTASKTFIVTDGATTPADKVTLQWNSTDSSLDFVFA